jgi:hypothetical protein
MAITTLKELIEEKYPKWIEEIIPERRLENDVDGRRWFLKAIEYGGGLKQKDLRTYVDRQGLNAEFVSRYKVEEVKRRKGISALKVEIAALYSFSKCFVQRYRGRMMWYKDDLSQKKGRTNHAIGQAYGLFRAFKKYLDKDNSA